LRQNPRADGPILQRRGVGYSSTSSGSDGDTPSAGHE
jgi:hypothetical protein